MDARNAHAYTPTRRHTNTRTPSARPSIQRRTSSHLHVQTAFTRRSMHFPREFARENPMKPYETLRKPRRDRDSNRFCAPSSHPSRAPISTRLGTPTWHTKAKSYPASLVVSRNDVFKTLEKPVFAQFERVFVPFLANKLAEHSVDMFSVSFRPFQAGIVRVDSAELACGDQKSTPRLRVIRPTLAAPFPGANTVAPTQVAYTFYDFRRLGWTLRHCRVAFRASEWVQTHHKCFGKAKK